MARILYLGGTGVISTACVARSLSDGHDVTVLNRGSGRRTLPVGVREIVADVHDPAGVRAASGGDQFDVVAQFVAFTPDQIERDLAVFDGRVGQYVFISSASAYQKPPQRLPIDESTPLRNPFWQYSRDKIACEDMLVAAYRERGFPVTIVRPSHTYDDTMIPTMGGWTDIARLRTGRPVVVHGDGTTPWTLTHADDFAVGFAGLLGHPGAVGEAFTVTGTHAPSWNQIYRWLADAAGVPEPDLVHVASDTIATHAPDLGPGLVGDKSHPGLFDTGKLHALVPQMRTTVTFDEGARRIIAHYDAHPDAQRVDEARDAAFDRMVAHARATG